VVGGHAEGRGRGLVADGADHAVKLVDARVALVDGVLKEGKERREKRE
jgi:hypothetical protein